MKSTAKNSVAISALILIHMSPSRAGDLNPPAGPISSTMKNLDQVEPRRPLETLPGDAGSLYVIAESGSYYLTQDLIGVAGKHGIRVEASNVTIDLNGFTLLGTAVGTDGSAIVAATFGLSVHSGIIRNWPGSGVAASQTHWGLFQDLTVLYNEGDGLSAGAESVVERCIADSNGQNGLRVNSHSRVAGCIAEDNGKDGIRTNDFCQVIECIASDNGEDGIDAYSALIERCQSNENESDGVEVTDDSVVRDCVLSGNSAGGIRVSGSSNQVMGCHTIGNARGIDVDAGQNLIVRNSLRGNATSLDVVAGNTVGPIVNNGNIAGSSNPHANYEF